MKKFAFTAILSIQYLALAIWLGGLVSVAFFAPVTFHQLDPDRFKAGQIVGGTLKLLGAINVVCGFLLVAGAVGLGFGYRIGRELSKWRMVLAIKIILPLIMTAVTVYLVSQVGPRMEVLRKTAQTTDYSQWQGSSKQEFDRLHALYTAASQAILFGGAGLFVVFALESSGQFLVKQQTDSTQSSADE